MSALSDLAHCTVADTTCDETMAGLAKRLLDSAPPTFALAGVSMGGYLAQEVLRQAPHRVIRLALIDTNAHADGEEQKAVRRDMINMAESGRFDAVMPRMTPRLLPKNRLSDVHLIDTMNAMADRIGPKAFVRQQKAIMGRVDGRSDLEKITCPTLVMCGADDALTPPAIHQDMADRLPNARLVILEDCGHLSPLERPRAVSAVMQYWLQEQISK